MKKFLVILTLLIVSLILFDFAYYRWGFYIPHNNQYDVISYSKGNEMFIKDGENFKSVRVKGRSEERRVGKECRL